MRTGRFFQHRLAWLGAKRNELRVGRGFVISPPSQEEISPGWSFGCSGAWESSCDYSIPWPGAQGPQVIEEPSSSLWISLNQPLPSRPASFR